MKAYDSLVVALGAYVAERHMRMFKICSRFFSPFKALRRAWGAVRPAWEDVFLSKCVQWCPSVLSAQAVSSAVSPGQSMRLLASFPWVQGVFGKLFEIEQGKLK